MPLYHVHFGLSRQFENGSSVLFSADWAQNLELMSYWALLT